MPSLPRRRQSGGRWCSRSLRQQSCSWQLESDPKPLLRRGPDKRARAVSFRELLPAVTLLAALIWAGLMRLIGSRISGRAGPSRLEAIARVTAVISAATVLVTLGTVAVRCWSGPKVHAPSPSVSGSGGPNVYILMLDGYPRADTLATTFGFDNGPFLAELESRDFDVAAESRSNYRKTSGHARDHVQRDLHG